MICTETIYIETASSLQEQCDRYDRIIVALATHMENVAAGNSDVSEYELDDGQVKIKTKYRDVVSIAEAIHRFESLRNKCLNKLNGRVKIGRHWRGLC